MLSVRLSQAAENDPRGVRVYSKAVFGALATVSYLQGLRNVFRLLRRRPQVGSIWDPIDEIRSFSYRSHRIFYWVRSDHVEIVRIFPHAQDADRGLGR